MRGETRGPTGGLPSRLSLPPPETFGDETGPGVPDTSPYTSSVVYVTPVQSGSTLRSSGPRADLGASVSHQSPFREKERLGQKVRHFISRSRTWTGGDPRLHSVHLFPYSVDTIPTCGPHFHTHTRVAHVCLCAPVLPDSTCTRVHRVSAHTRTGDVQGVPLYPRCTRGHQRLSPSCPSLHTGTQNMYVNTHGLRTGVLSDTLL